MASLTLPVVLRRAAELDLMATEDWYESQRDGLGGEFREEVDAVISRIADNPLAYPEGYRRARRARVRRFPHRFPCCPIPPASDTGTVGNF